MAPCSRGIPLLVQAFLHIIDESKAQRCRMNRIRARRTGAAFHFKIRIEDRVDKNDREGIIFDCMSCLMMCAFAFDAYLNFLGHKLIEGWDERMKYHKKLRKVFAYLDHSPDTNTKPYSSLERVKTFRDLIAHGKPNESEYDEVIEGAAEELEPRWNLSAAWMEQCTSQIVFEIYDDVDAIWKELLEKSNISFFDTTTHGMGGLTLIEKIDTDAAKE
jgi:hypothetical protein